MSSTNTLYLLFLTTGFTVGFGHCIGMCGPIVVSLSLNLKNKNVLISHILYNAGRISTYTILGALMGATGSFTIVTANIAGIQKGTLIFAGLLIIVMGLAMSGFVPLGKIFGDYCKADGFISKTFKKLSNAKSTFSYYPIGIILGLLPCGPVYTALIAAARAGMEAKNTALGILSGAGLMFSFGIGTIPALLLVAKLSDLGWLKKREVIYKISGVIMMAVGIYFVIKAISY